MHIESFVLIILGLISIITFTMAIHGILMFIRQLNDDWKIKKIQRKYAEKYDDPFYVEEDK
tara:strand:+ start:1776 stop:1958 length:183 start_codon:yes stop_codon:yes gene_type:complete